MGTEEDKEGGMMPPVRAWWGALNGEEGADEIEADVNGVVDAIDDPDEFERLLIDSNRGGSMVLSV